MIKSAKAVSRRGSAGNTLAGTRRDAWRRGCALGRAESWREEGADGSALRTSKYGCNPSLSAIVPTQYP